MHVLCAILLLYIIDPSDYMSVNDSVTFEPQPGGQSSPQCADIMIVNDELLEGNELFTVEIQNPSQGVSPDSMANCHNRFTFSYAIFWLGKDNFNSYSKHNNFNAEFVVY